jgi:hypothetical protein
MRAACRLAVWAVIAAILASVAAAQGTSEFTLSALPFDPDAVAPSGVSSSSIAVGLPSNTSPSVTVTLTCQVTGQQGTTSPPACIISPSSVVSPGSATATVTTQSTTPTQAYSVTITGTGPTTTFTTPAIPLTVLAVTPQFTINVTGAVAPTSVPAGSGAQATVTVNPLYGYQTPKGGGITLACASMTPLVTIPPTCSFTYPNGGNSLQVSGTTSQPATLNINTFGPVTTGAHNQIPGLRLWLALPVLGLVGFGSAARRKHAGSVMVALLMLCGIFLLTPGCGSSATTTTTPNGVTPANTYTFTIVGVDSNGVVSSNTTSTTTTNSGPSVSLTVTAPPKTP